MGKQTSGGVNTTYIKISSPCAVWTQVCTTQNVILGVNKTSCFTQTTSHTPVIEDLPEFIDLNLNDDVLDHDNITLCDDNNATHIDINLEDDTFSTGDNDTEKKKQVSTSIPDLCRVHYSSLL
jgi:hypothetical protein